MTGVRTDMTVAEVLELSAAEARTVETASDDGAVAEIVNRVAPSYPEVPISEVTALVAQCLAATSDARVQTFRVVLAERETRRRLRARYRPATPTAQGDRT